MLGAHLPLKYTAAALGAVGLYAVHRFLRKDKSEQDPVQQAKEMRENLSEDQIDKTLKDSFPSSDPPGWY